MKKIELKSIDQLRRGDIIRHKGSGEAYVIDSNYGSFAIGMRSVHVSNPIEWYRMDFEEEDKR